MHPKEQWPLNEEGMRTYYGIDVNNIKDTDFMKTFGVRFHSMLMHDYYDRIEYNGHARSNTCVHDKTS